ncbi:FxSxx-COOH system tetratricopeptide repeat protein [Paractinoplanes rishiriensis]|uniref:ATP-binding protein n=1 Tax=Paractinoplanes rishiriensis TaxID=1050105 RepID=A0A919MT52_9ACTN|nr:FxSxx-COOH system tetratricopeptide repeat protein [Actinoplanes rishiriensis]GIE98901.1 ATP-binding protein [Actinoplanes rishiriensis]
MTGVFVSHAGRDLAWAEWVAWQLHAAGHEVELDRWDWAAGDNFVLRMSQALDRAEVVVAIVSQAYFEVERFTTEEWTAVIAGRGRLVLLRVEDVAVEAVLRPYIFRDVFGLAETSARQVVLQAVDGPAGKPSRPPAFPGSSPGPRLPGLLPQVWNVPIQNAVFTGRDAMLADLRDRLTTGAPLQVLHGIGGVGKTTLAIEYAYRFANSYELVWWIDAEQPDRIGEQIAALTMTAGWVPPTSDVPTGVAAARQRLRGIPGWLVVFDNAEDPATLPRWLPARPPGHVLVTSRNPNWRQLGNPVPVDVFARTESTTLLRRLLPTIAATDADRIAVALADLPLAVAQAANMLTETGITPADYLDAVAEQTAEVLAEGTPIGYPVSLAASVAVALRRLDGEDPAAVQLLRLCAALAPEPIPGDLFTTAPDDALPEPLATVAGSTIAVHRSLGRLGRYGLARVADGTVQLHRLTQAILTATDPDRPGTGHRAAALLGAAVPDDEGNEPASWPRWALLIPHLLATDPAESDDENLQLTADRAAWYLISRGELHAGLEFAQRLHDRWRDRLGREHQRTLSAANIVVVAFHALGRYDDARRLGAEVLAYRRLELGDDHRLTLISGSNLANSLHQLGEYERARELNEDILARRRRVLGDDHPDTLGSATNLAINLQRLAEHERARQLNEDTLAGQRRVLGDDHPDTLASATNLAVNMRDAGDYEQARQLDEDTLTRYRRVLGEDHPATLLSATNLAVSLRHLGEYERARQLDEATLARRRRVLGDDHADTRRSAGNLAINLRLLGEKRASA